MTIDSIMGESLTYQVTTPLYEGPLDLLLRLIERAELDITKLALAQVTNQFLQYLNDIQDRAVAEVSSFLVIAAKLIQIKSEALLPQPPMRELDEEDPGEALARQLIAYKRYKEIAESLAQRHSQGFRSYLRLVAPPKIDVKLDLSGIGVADLVEAARSVFLLQRETSSLSAIVKPYRVTVREKISLIISTLQEKTRTSFRSLLSKARSRLEVLVTFFAVLELVKRFQVDAAQEALFGDIELSPAEDWNENTDFDLEFSD